MSDYTEIPSNATLDVKPFTAHAPEDKVQHFKQLLELSPVGPAVFENTKSGRKFGIAREWLADAKAKWLAEFDWRKFEDRINSFPNFKAVVKDEDSNNIEMHFMALFSERDDATPIVFLHGWPSSFSSFMDILDLLKSKYTPQDLPYHVIVPSLPGYAYSGGPPLDRDYGVDKAASAINSLMVGLGFGSGYISQGGDLGSFISRILAMTSESCKGMHVNMMAIPGGEEPKEPAEKAAMAKAAEFVDTAYGFALEQGTRTATIGFVLSSSPLALLSWIGEKMLAWTDEDPSLQKIFETVTLYWMTDTVSRSFYHNRALANNDDDPKIARLGVITSMSVLHLPFVQKPCGYSLFAKEIVPVPRSWAEKTCNLVSFNHHESGGHFPAMEKPVELLEDVEQYLKIVKGNTI